MKYISARSITTTCLGFILACAPLAAVHAFNFRNGDLSGALDTDLTYGLQFRTDDAATDNSGAYGNRALYPDRGDIFSNQVRASVTLALEWGNNYGALVRGNAFFDFEGNDAKLRGEAKEELESQENLTDAYVYGYFGDDQQLMIRIGKQVISWGENTFIQGSLNDINTVNLSSLRSPGRELKDAFVGTDAIYATYNFLENWTLEGFVLLDFDPVVIDPMGSFWTTLDGAGTGGGHDKDGNGILGEPPGGNCVTYDSRPCDLFGGGLTRVSDNDASSGGQYGVALRRFLPGVFNGSEIGFYYQNLHDHSPAFSGYKGSGHYFLDYAENIERYGVSFNTNIGGWAIGGEYSFRNGAPIQLTAPLVNSTPKNPLTTPDWGSYQKGYGEVDRHQVQFTFQRVWGVVHAIGADGSMTLAEVAYGWIDNLPTNKTDLFEGNALGLYAPFPGGPLVVPGGKGTVTNNFSGFQILQNVTYANVFDRFEMTPYVAWKWDVDGVSQEIGGGKLFIEDRQALTVGVDSSYQGGRYKAGISWTQFYGQASERNAARGRLNGTTDRDFVAISVSTSF